VNSSKEAGTGGRCVIDFGWGEQSNDDSWLLVALAGNKSGQGNV
jgi:hypothetical protein